jgi:putative membrane protein
MASNHFPHILASLFTLFFIVLGIAPVSREVWIAEIIPVVFVFSGLVFTFPKFRFSNLSYIALSIWLFWHTIGGHYTFSNVPFDWVTHMIRAERNHFDRVGHFSIGLYAFPMAEWLLRNQLCKTKLAMIFSLFFIMSVAAAYEIIEWWYAVLEGGNAGVEFLGSQGDIWDAQKDMLADTLGAICALALFYMIRPDRKAEVISKKNILLN